MRNPIPKISLPESLRVGGLLILLAGLGLAATGCSNNNNNGAATATPVYLRVWRLGQTEDTLRSSLSAFTTKNPQVKTSYIQGNPATYELDAIKSMASKTGPDVWSIPDDWLGDHISRVTPLPKNYYFPLDSKGKRTATGPTPAEQTRKLYPAGIADQLIGTDKTSVYGVPMNADTLRLYVNDQLLNTAFEDYRQSAGRNATGDQITPIRQLLSQAPATWLDLIEQSKYVTVRNGQTISRATIAMGTTNNIPLSADILQLLMLQNNVNVVTQDRKNVDFHIPQTLASGERIVPGQRSLRFFSDFSNPASQAYTWNTSMPDAVEAFGTGKVAMILGYGDLYNVIKEKYPRLSFQVAPVPQKSLTETPINLVRFKVETVTKTADNIPAGFVFMTNYTNDENAENLARDSRTYSPYLSKLQQLKNDPIAQQIVTGKAIFKRSHTQFDAAMNQMVIDVTQNGFTDEQATVKAADSITKLLQSTTDL